MKISKDALYRAAGEAGIPPQQAEALWSRLESGGAAEAGFNSLNIAYYFGAMVIIGAMTFFFGLAWERVGGPGILLLALAYGSIFGWLGANLFLRRKLYIAGGLLTTVAVCMTPLAVYGLERTLGFWPEGDPGTYHDFHVWIKGSWIFMETATLMAGAVALRFIPFPFLTAPIAFTLWYMSMDLTPLLFGQREFTGNQGQAVSMIFGALMMIAAYCIDRRTKIDYSFWMYLFGIAAFWGGLTLMDGGGPWSRFAYCMINVALISIGPLVDRRVFVIFGSFGVAGYLGYLAFQLFRDSLLLPIALTALGLGVIGAAIFYQKNRAKLEGIVLNSVPPGLRRLSPAARSRF